MGNTIRIVNLLRVQKQRGTASLEPELREVKLGLQLDSLVRQTLLPAYRRAVDALDPGASLELATHIVSALRAAIHAQRDGEAKVKDGLGGALVSTPNSPIDDTADAAKIRLAQLQTTTPVLRGDLQVLSQDLAVQLSPQIFKGQSVLGKAATPTLRDDPSEYLSNEAVTTAALIGVVQQARAITGITGPISVELTDEQRTQVAALIEPWHSRPANYAFLVRVLGEVGIWEEVSAAKGPSGRTLQTTLAKTEAQSLVTGKLADVGDFDSDEVAQLLPGTSKDQIVQNYTHQGDGAASAVFDRVRTAAPDARGPLVRQIAAMNRLDFMCEHLPWKQVEEMYRAIAPFDAKAAELLRPYFDGKGGGESMHQIYMDKVDDQLKEGHEYRAGAWYVLDFLHNVFTAGFEHEYSAAYDAHEQGWITDNEFKSEVTKAAGKAALITAVSAASGGMVGEWVQGLAAPLGAGGASVVGGAAGGFTAGVSGHFTGDVYDQMLNGKQGFDSAHDYLKSGVLGGGMGATAAMLGSMGVGAGKYLDSSLQRPADIYAARFPRMARFLESARQVRVRSAAAVNVKVSELAELIGAKLGGLGPDALAFAGDLRSMPPDMEVRVSFRPLEDLNRPMMNENTGGADRDAGEAAGGASSAKEPPIQIDRVEPVRATSPVEGDAVAPRSSSSTTSSEPTSKTTESTSSTPEVPTTDTTSELKLGKLVGSGGEKDVYAVEGRSDIVVGVAKPEVTAARLASEVEMLGQLKDLGIPVVEVEGTTQIGGRPALIMKRYAQGSKTVARTIGGKVKLVGESDLLNSKSIQDLEHIRTVLKETPVWINDLQFLIGEDGTIVVADALEFTVGKPPSKANLNTIERLIEASRAAMQRKPQ